MNTIKFVFNYRDLMINSGSLCILKYRILNELKENIKVLRFNSKRIFPVIDKIIKLAHHCELKHILFTLPLVHEE